MLAGVGAGIAVATIIGIAYWLGTRRVGPVETKPVDRAPPCPPADDWAMPPTGTTLDDLFARVLRDQSVETRYVTKCEHCGQRNRWKPDRMHQKPRCAKCWLPLTVRFQ